MPLTIHSRLQYCWMTSWKDQARGWEYQINQKTKKNKSWQKCKLIFDTCYTPKAWYRIQLNYDKVLLFELCNIALSHIRNFIYFMFACQINKFLLWLVIQEYRFSAFVVYKMNYGLHTINALFLVKSINSFDILDNNWWKKGLKKRD